MGPTIPRTNLLWIAALSIGITTQLGCPGSEIRERVEGGQEPAIRFLQPTQSQAFEGGELGIADVESLLIASVVSPGDRIEMRIQDDAVRDTLNPNGEDFESIAGGLGKRFNYTYGQLPRGLHTLQAQIVRSDGTTYTDVTAEDLDAQNLGATDTVDIIVTASCEEDAECDDGNECSVDRCVVGLCNYVKLTTDGCEPPEGTPPPDAEDDVTVGGECKTENKGAECFELYPDIADQCTTWTCDDFNVCQPVVFEGIACEDGDLCTTGEVCTADGECPAGDPATCDDGDFCTDDTCDSALGCQFEYNPDTCPCLDDAACAEVDDEDLCNGVLRCVNFQCVTDPDTIVVCDDDDEACFDNVCDPASGDCVITPASGEPCDDGSLCTEGDICLDGICGGTALDCEDGNVCTDDACDPAAGCVNIPAPGLPCEDGDACTLLDECDRIGGCIGGVPLDCDDENLCTVDACDPATGCIFDPVPLDGSFCEDDDECTGPGECFEGLCVVPLIACDDGNPCTTDSCDSATGCVFTNNADPCDDGNACTSGDQCQDGTCQPGTPVDCDDGDACTDEAECNPDFGCLPSTPTVCDDGNICTDDSCDPATGCINTPNTAICDDGNPCTSGDVCVDGACEGEGTPLEICDDGNPCTEDSCTLDEGCVNSPLDGVPCDDGNACTLNDTCSGGVCVPGATDPCDDGNECTDDSCDPASGCVNTPNTAPCDDGDICTEGDVCSGGACAGTAVICDDGDVCTDDVCDPVVGCVSTNNTAPCDDGEFCTVDDACVDGECLGGGPNPACADVLCELSGITGDEVICPMDMVRVNEAVPMPVALQFSLAFNFAQAELTRFQDEICFAPGVCAIINVPVDNSQVSTGHQLNLNPAISTNWNGTGSGILVNLTDPTTAVTEAYVDGDGVSFVGDTLFLEAVFTLKDNLDPSTPGFVNYTDVVVSEAAAEELPNFIDDGIIFVDGDPVECVDADCEDGNPCTTDFCGAAGECVNAPADGTPCDDGDACTAGDSCSAGACVPGDAVICDDGDVCNGTESCDPASGCVAGEDLICADDNDCTDDACDPAAGCVFTNNTNPCDDGDFCTIDDACSAGACAGGGDNPACDAVLCEITGAAGDEVICPIQIARVADTVPLPVGIQFDLSFDDSVATLSQFQDDVEILPGLIITQATPPSPLSTGHQVNLNPDPTTAWPGAGTVLAVNLSDPTSALSTAYLDGGMMMVGEPLFMEAVFTLTAPIAPGTPESLVTFGTAPDSVVVTNAAAEALTDFVDNNIIFVDGEETLCDPALCVDGNPCTADECDPATNACINPPIDGAPCDDGDACTAGDSCSAGACAPGAPVVCDDGDVCNGAETCDSTSGCIDGAALDCDDDNICTDDTCDAVLGCTYTNNTAPCDDGEFCTIDDACLDGSCAAGDDNPECENVLCEISGVAGDEIICPMTMVRVSDTVPLPAALQYALNFDGTALTLEQFQDEVCPGGPGTCITLPTPPSTVSTGHSHTINPTDTTLWDGSGQGLLVNLNDPSIGVTEAYLDGGGATVEDPLFLEAVFTLETDIAPGDPASYVTYGDVIVSDSIANPLEVFVDDLTIFVDGEGAACTPADCIDGNPCTEDICDPLVGCSNPPIEGGPCDDGDACTSGDSCSAGACVGGAAVICDDGDACNGEESCDSATGCVAGTALTCNDENECTDDTCDPAAGCVFTNNTAACDDGDFCTINDVCSEGACGGPDVNPECENTACVLEGLAGDEVECILNIARVADTVPLPVSLQFDLNFDFAAAGLERFEDDVEIIPGITIPSEVPPSSLSTGHNVSIEPTMPIAWVGTGKFLAVNLSDPTAALSPAYLDAGGALIDDPAFIRAYFTLKNDVVAGGPGSFVYYSEVVVSDALANSLAVNIDDLTIFVDGESGALCDVTDPTFCDDGNPCTEDSCNPLLGCSNLALTGTSCADADLCDGDEVCDDGSCVDSTPLVCDDGDACTDDSCDPATGCTTTTTTCDDGDACTDDSCDSATGCVFSAIDCSDGDACNGAETCDPASGCQAGAPLDCDDGNICTSNGCDPASGCTSAPVAGCCETAADCDDGDACTNDACDAASGNCSNTAITCDDGVSCTDDTCDPDSGCVFVANDGNCSDGDACNGAEACDPTAGCLAGTAPTCDDGDACTDDDCAPAVGCTATPVVCDDGVDCTTDSCDPATGCVFAEDDSVCDDGQACTDDACAAGVGCINAENDGNCADGDACNGDELCDAATGCQPGTPTSCDDGNACTDDTCDTDAGCLNTPADCDDGIDCTFDSCDTTTGCTNTADDSSCEDGNLCTDDVCDPSAGCTFPNNAAPCDDEDFCTINDTCSEGTCSSFDPNPACASALCEVYGVAGEEFACPIDVARIDEFTQLPVGLQYLVNFDGTLIEADRYTDFVSIPGLPVAVEIEVPPAVLSTGHVVNNNPPDLTLWNDLPGAPDSNSSAVGGTLIVNTGDPTAAVSNAYFDATSTLVDDPQIMTLYFTLLTDVSVDSPALVILEDLVATTAAAEPLDANVVDNIIVVSEPGGFECITDDQCDDGEECTGGSCVVIAAGCLDDDECDDGEVCVAGECLPDTVCDDSNPCTDDTFDGASCVFTPNSAPCDDGDACTTGDTCSGGACSADPVICEDDFPCDGTDICVGGECIADFSSIPFCGDGVLSEECGEQCDDGNVDGGDGCNSCQIVCDQSDPLSCDDDNPCTTDSCLANGNCSNVNTTGACDDGNPCTVGESCIGGSCQGGTGPSCNDGIACTMDSCTPESGCVNVEMDAACDDGEPCTIDVCNGAAGCEYTALMNGMACDDGNACTEATTCTSGVCAGGGETDCDDGNDCTTDGCNPVTGCTYGNQNGTPCDDGEFCTLNDQCSAGVCEAGSANPDPLCCDESIPGDCPDVLCEVSGIAGESMDCIIPIVSAHDSSTGGPFPLATALQFTMNFNGNWLALDNFYTELCFPGVGCFEVKAANDGMAPSPQPLSSGHTLTLAPSETPGWNATACGPGTPCAGGESCINNTCQGSGGFGAVVVVNIASPSATLTDAYLDAGGAIVGDSEFVTARFDVLGNIAPGAPEGEIKIGAPLATDEDSNELQVEIIDGILVTSP